MGIAAKSNAHLDGHRQSLPDRLFRIVSYWRYQFRPNQSGVTNIEDFIDLLKDFDPSLSLREIR
jgi:hypothetical protein